MAEDRLHLRAEVDVASAARVVGGFYSHGVWGKNQPLTGFAPDREGEHSAQSFDAGCVPFDERAKHDFGVAGRGELVTEADELVAEFDVVVILAVEDQGDVIVCRTHRLRAGGSIDRLQPRGAEGDGFVLPDPLLIRA